MPKTMVRIYQESDGSVPLLEWLDEQPEKVQDKFTVLIELLEEKGYDLRRPSCDFLESGIYELQARYLNVRYRILYGFAGKNVILLSHGCTRLRYEEDREDRGCREDPPSTVCQEW